MIITGFIFTLYEKTAKREGAISHRHFTASLTLFPSLSFVKHVTRQALTSQDSQAQGSASGASRAKIQKKTSICISREH